MHQASRRVFVVGAFFVLFHRGTNSMELHSLAQLHSYRGRRSGAIPFVRQSWCLVLHADFAGTQQRSDVVEAQKALPTNASARDAVSTPTNLSRTSGGIQGTREGSIPLPTAEHQSGAPLLNNDRVVQRRRAGQRCHNRPAPPSPHAQHAAVGRWLRRCSHPRSS
jgi:hypothetical protein